MGDSRDAIEKCKQLFQQEIGLYTAMLETCRKKAGKSSDPAALAALNAEHAGLMRGIDDTNRKLVKLLAELKSAHAVEESAFAAYRGAINALAADIRKEGERLDAEVAAAMNGIKEELRLLGTARTIIKRISRKSDTRNKGRFIDKLN
jgi:hypothetical protein